MNKNNKPESDCVNSPYVHIVLPFQIGLFPRVFCFIPTDDLLYVRQSYFSHYSCSENEDLNLMESDNW